MSGLPDLSVSTHDDAMDNDEEFVSEIKIKTEEDANEDNLPREVFYFNASDDDGSYVKTDQDQILIAEGIDQEEDSKAGVQNLMDVQFVGLKDEVGNQLTISHCVKYRSDGNGKSVKFWECGICHKEFSHQYILMRHLPTHTDERKYVCNQCGKAFRQMSTLSQHRAIHSKLRPHVCDVCQKTFNRVSTLISHRKTHTSNKPHCCHLCNKAFHQKGNLRNHIFTHTNERPYKCDVCHEGFNQMSNLMCHKFKAHQRADKPKYQCPTCDKLFDRRIALRNHEQYEHGDQSNASGVGGGSVGGVANGGVANSGGRDIATPSVKYTNGVMVSKINTAAMKHAMAVGVVPFALLKPTDGIPVLVRVFPSGDNQLLVPATSEDLKKYTRITKCEMCNSDDDKEGCHDETCHATSKNGMSMSVRVPVVAVVIQRISNGVMQMDIVEPGPDSEDRPYSDGDFFEEYDDRDISSGDEKDYDYADEDGGLHYDSHMYEAAASLVGMQVRPRPIEVDEGSVEIFNHDEIDIDITNSVIDLEKDHKAYGIIAENGYNVGVDERQP